MLISLRRIGAVTLWIFIFLNGLATSHADFRTVSIVESNRPAISQWIADTFGNGIKAAEIQETLDWLPAACRANIDSLAEQASKAPADRDYKSALTQEFQSARNNFEFIVLEELRTKKSAYEAMAERGSDYSSIFSGLSRRIYVANALVGGERFVEANKFIRDFESAIAARQAGRTSKALERATQTARSLSQTKNDGVRLTSQSEAENFTQIREIGQRDINIRSGLQKYRNTYNGAAPTSDVNRAVTAPPVRNADRRQISRLVAPDAFEQWLRWEETENQSLYRESTKPVTVGAALIDRSNIRTISVDSVPQGVERFLSKQGKILWPKHPYNTDETVPYFSAKTAVRLKGRFTASRSIVFPRQRLSIKMGTNFPHRTEQQDSKARMKEEVLDQLLWSRHIESTERKIGKDPDLVILKDVESVIDKKTGEGFIIRDLSPLDDGAHYYLPGAAVPYSGRKIAQLHHENFAKFWARHYAETLGRASANFLLRYGAQGLNPHSQQWKIQLDRNLYPTGALAVLDLGDSELFKPVAEGLGIPMIDPDGKPNPLLGDGKFARVDPYFDSAMMGMDESIDGTIQSYWRIRNNLAFLREIYAALGVRADLTHIEQIGRESDAIIDEVLRITENSRASPRRKEQARNAAWKWFEASRPDFTREEDRLTDLLASPAGQTALKAHRQILEDRMQEDAKRPKAIRPKDFLKLAPIGSDETSAATGQSSR